MKFAILLESSPAEMTEALRWITLLKPYMRQATVGKARKYIAQLKHDMAVARKTRTILNPDPMKYLESEWYRVVLFIPKDVVDHLLPSRDLSFHADDEFDIYERREYYISIRPDLNEKPFDTDLPLPQLVQKWLLQAVIDFREELKSMI